MVNCDRSIVDAPTITTSHRTQEILDALGAVFFNKCYICEKKLSSPNNFEVDHFIPKNEDKSLEFEWENLHLCCKECNGSRLKTTPQGGFLNPCDINEDVEKEIIYKLPKHEHNQPIFISASPNPSQKVLNIIEQLKRMHYGGTAVTKMRCESFRETIKKQAHLLMRLLLDENRAEKNKDFVMLAEIQQKIENMLAVNAPFTMLMRSVAKDYR